MTWAPESIAQYDELLRLRREAYQWHERALHSEPAFAEAAAEQFALQLSRLHAAERSAGLPLSTIGGTWDRERALDECQDEL